MASQIDLEDRIPKAASPGASGTDVEVPVPPRTPAIDLEGRVPPEEPSSVTRNLQTGWGRGLGNLLEGYGRSQLEYNQTVPGNRYPRELIPEQGQIAEHVVQGVTGGKPYKPQSPGEKLVQDAVAGAVESAPLAALGGGGVYPFLVRQAANIAGSFGGEQFKQWFPEQNQTVMGLLGSLLAGGGVTGAARSTREIPRYLPRPLTATVEREALRHYVPDAAFDMPIADARRQLAAQGGYYTQPRVNAMSDLNVQQNLNNTLSPGGALAQPAYPPPPGAGTRLITDIWDQFSRRPLIPGMTTAGITALLAPDAGYALPLLMGTAASTAAPVVRGVGTWGGANRAANFNQQVQDMLQNQRTNLWQQSQKPSGLLDYATGVLAPLAAP